MKFETKNPEIIERTVSVDLSKFPESGFTNKKLSVLYKKFVRELSGKTLIVKGPEIRANNQEGVRGVSFVRVYEKGTNPDLDYVIPEDCCIERKDINK